jgi:hypothetical protein
MLGSSWKTSGQHWGRSSRCAPSAALVLARPCCKPRCLAHARRMQGAGRRTVCCWCWQLRVSCFCIVWNNGKLMCPKYWMAGHGCPGMWAADAVMIMIGLAIGVRQSHPAMRQHLTSGVGGVWQRHPPHSAAALVGLTTKHRWTRGMTRGLLDHLHRTCYLQTGKHARVFFGIRAATFLPIDL